MPVSADQLAIDLEFIRLDLDLGFDYSLYDSYQLKQVFDVAVQAKNWTVVKKICELDGPKPEGASKEDLLQEATTKENWLDVYDMGRVFNDKEDYIPMPGPMPKSKYTKQLEEIARGLMRGEKFAFSKDGSDDVITVGGIRYNWTQVREHANFDHIDMVQSDFKLYQKFLDTNNVHNAIPELNPNAEARLRAKLYAKYIADGKKLPDPPISFQEMQAIYIYSGGFFTFMNRLLRGNADLSQSPNNHRAAIIHSVMAASGLKRVPETTVKQVVRGADYRKHVHETWVKAAAEHAVVPFSGFVSTAIKETGYGELPVIISLTNVKGVYIAPIAKYSSEQEFLIPPCHVQMESYVVEHDEDGNLKHKFIGAMVTDLSVYHDEDYDTAPETTTTEPSTAEPISLTTSATANEFSNEDLTLETELLTAPDPIKEKFEAAMQEMLIKWIANLMSQVIDPSKTPVEWDYLTQATELYTKLNTAVYNHFWLNLTNVEQFKKGWNEAIEQAKPTLQNIDSDWNAYLNSLQAASNWVSNIFSSDDFFAATKPHSQQVVGNFFAPSKQHKDDGPDSSEPNVKPPL